MKNEDTANILISGPDAENFLQGLLTCDVLKLATIPVLAAACNKKGRIIANFWIWRDDVRFHVVLPAAMSDILMMHLKKYVLRSKVNFNADEKTNPSPSHSLAMGTGNNNTETCPPVWIVPETSEQFTPQMIGLEKHGGVSFTKGCYLGQEIIARTEHLGKLKRHLYQITCDTDNIKVTDDIQNKKGEKLGTVVAVVGNKAFAVIEDRALKETLNVNGAIVTPQLNTQ